MTRSKDIFMNERIKEEADKDQLQRLGQEAYLTIRKDQVIRKEAIQKPVKK